MHPLPLVEASAGTRLRSSQGPVSAEVGGQPSTRSSRQVGHGQVLGHLVQVPHVSAAARVVSAASAGVVSVFFRCTLTTAGNRTAGLLQRYAPHVSARDRRYTTSTPQAARFYRCARGRRCRVGRAVARPTQPHSRIPVRAPFAFWQGRVSHFVHTVLSDPAPHGELSGRYDPPSLIGWVGDGLADHCTTFVLSLSPDTRAVVPEGRSGDPPCLHGSWPHLIQGLRPSPRPGGEGACLAFGCRIHLTSVRV